MPPFMRQSSSHSELPDLPPSWNPHDQIAQYPELRDPERLRYASDEAREIAKLPEKRQLILKKKSTIGSIGGSGRKSQNLAPTLAYLRGEVNVPPCLHCTRFVGPFPECVSLRGHFDLACTNCAYNDHGARCSFRPSSNNNSSSSNRATNGRDGRRRSRSRSRSRSPPRRDVRSPRSPPRGPGGHDIWRPASAQRGFEIKGAASAQGSSLNDRITRVNPQISSADRHYSPPRERERPPRQDGHPTEHASDPAKQKRPDQTGRDESRSLPAPVDRGPVRSVSPTKSPSLGSKRDASTAFEKEKDVRKPDASDDVGPKLLEGVAEAHTSHGTAQNEAIFKKPALPTSIPTAPGITTNPVTQGNTKVDSASSENQPPLKKQRTLEDSSKPAQATSTGKDVQPQSTQSPLAPTPDVTQTLQSNSTSGIVNAPPKVTVSASRSPSVVTSDPTKVEPLMAPWHRKSPAIVSEDSETASDFERAENAITTTNDQIGLTSHAIGVQNEPNNVIDKALQDKGKTPLNHSDPDPNPHPTVPQNTAPTESKTAAISDSDVATAPQLSESPTDPPLSGYEKVLAEVMALTPQQQHEELSKLLFRMSALHDAISRHTTMF